MAAGAETAGREVVCASSLQQFTDEQWIQRKVRARLPFPHQDSILASPGGYSLHSHEDWIPRVFVPFLEQK